MCYLKKILFRINVNLKRLYLSIYWVFNFKSVSQYNRYTYTKVYLYEEIAVAGLY